jgi:hypothetical protein
MISANIILEIREDFRLSHLLENFGEIIEDLKSLEPTYKQRYC